MMKRRCNKRLALEARFEKARRHNLVNAGPGLHDCILVLDGLKPDFNIGKIFRSADAFSVREIYLIGVHAFDPNPAKGAVRWVRFCIHEDFAACHRTLIQAGYTLAVPEPGGSDLLGSCSLPAKTAFVLGREQFGLSFDPTEYSDITKFSIPQWGHVQSLNVSVAASIVLYEYTRQSTAGLCPKVEGGRGWVQTDAEEQK